jgi:hypothetical protein
MAFMWDQRERLLRDDDWTAPALAEELYCMFGPQVPNNTEAPVNVSLPTGSQVPPFQISNAPLDNIPMFDFHHADGTPGGNIFFSGGNFFFQGPGSQPSLMGGGGGGGGGPTVPVWG